MPESLLTNVVATAIIAICGWLLSIVIRSVFLPWVRAVRYNGHKLSGTWHVNYTKQSHKDVPDQIIILTQVGPRLNGKVTVNRWVDGSKTNKLYDYEGQIIGDKVLFTFHRAGEPAEGFGSMILQVQDEPRTLNGYGVWVEPDHTISCFERTCTWAGNNHN